MTKTTKAIIPILAQKVPLTIATIIRNKAETTINKEKMYCNERTVMPIKRFSGL
jgi:hypothetical protein